MPKAKNTEKRVKFKLPRLPGSNANQDQYVSLNGKGYIIRRGVEVEVPEGVYEILAHAQLAEDAAYEFAEEKSFKEPKQ